MATNLKVKSTLTFGTDVSEYAWDNVDYKFLAKLERKLINGLSKMNDAAVEFAEKGKSEGFSGNEANKQKLTYEFVITKSDGSPYHKTTLVYENMPEADAAWMKGVLGGELADTKPQRKEKRKAAGWLGL